MQPKNIFKNEINPSAIQALESNIDSLRERLLEIETQRFDFGQAADMMVNLNDKRNYEADVAALKQKELSILHTLHKKLGEYVQMHARRDSKAAKKIFAEMRNFAEKISQLDGWKSPVVSRSDFTGGCERCRERDLRQALLNELAEHKR
ncbi:MAG: hypothetical protein LBJ73_02555 [Rickettsiales bacterium]|nr:hypothetical protein [Rickettsiales bacterium]